MKVITIVARLVFCLVLMAGITAAFLTISNTQAQTSPPSIIAYGDSLISGLGVSSTLSLPGQLARLMGDEYSITNRGQRGAETEILLNNLQDRVLDDNPDIVILYGGGADLIPDFDNDGRVPAEETFANLEEIITRLQDDGVVVILLGHGSYEIPGFTLVDYTREFRNLAQSTGAYFVPDVMNNIALRSDYTNNDRIHPNARGYGIITQRVFPTVQKAIYEEFPDAPLSGSCQIYTPGQDRTELSFNTDQTVMTGQQVWWKAFAVGGFGNYQYNWQIEGNPRQGQEISTIFDTEGERNARFEVRSQNSPNNDMQIREETIQCEQSLDVVTPPLRGACEIEMRIFEDEVKITWNTDISGGENRNNYTFKWEIDGEVVGTSSRLEQTYDRDDDGEKSASVSVESGPHDAELSCGIEIPEMNTATSTSTLQRASCNVNGYDFEIGDYVRWSADVQPFSQYNSENEIVANTAVFWEGDGGLSTSSQAVSVAYTSSGVKTARAEIQAVAGEKVAAFCEVKIVPDTDGRTRGGSDGGGCFIATAAFGTALASEIDVLRDFRDAVLLESNIGRMFVSTYYTLSPPLADLIGRHESLRAITRWILQPIVTTVRLAGML